MDERAERRRAYEALPFHRRVVELARFKRRAVRLRFAFMRLRAKDGRPRELPRVVLTSLRTILLDRYE